MRRLVSGARSSLAIPSGWSISSPFVCQIDFGSGSIALRLPIAPPLVERRSDQFRISLTEGESLVTGEGGVEGKGSASAWSARNDERKRRKRGDLRAGDGTGGPGGELSASCRARCRDIAGVSDRRIQRPGISRIGVASSTGRQDAVRACGIHLEAQIGERTSVIDRIGRCTGARRKGGVELAEVDAGAGVSATGGRAVIDDRAADLVSSDSVGDSGWSIACR